MSPTKTSASVNIRRYCTANWPSPPAPSTSARRLVCGAQRVEAVLDSSIGGQPSAGQRRRLHRVERPELVEIVAMADCQPFRVATVLEQADLGAARAEHLLSGGAHRTGPTPPWGVDDHWTQFGVHAGDLVAQHERERTRIDPVDDVEIAVAHPTGGDLDDIGAARRRPILQFEGCSGLPEDDRPHGSRIVDQRSQMAESAGGCTHVRDRSFDAEAVDGAVLRGPHRRRRVPQPTRPHHHRHRQHLVHDDHDEHQPGSLQRRVSRRRRGSASRS